MGGLLTLLPQNRRRYVQRVIRTRQSNIVAYWPMDDVSGSTARDASNQGRTGLYIASPTLNQSANLFSAAPLFNSGVSTQYNRVDGNIASVFSYSEGTYMGWYKASSFANWSDATVRRLLLLQVDSSNRIIINTPGGADSLVATYTGGGTVKTVTTTGVTGGFNGWVHVAVTWSKANDQFILYVNGVAGTPITGLPTVTGTMTLGQIPVHSTNVFPGNVVHAPIWNTPLSAAEIAALAYPLPAKFDRLVVLEGDSLTVGGQNGSTPYPKLMNASVISSEEWRVANVATAGEKVSQMNIDAATQVDARWDSAHHKRQIAVLWGGTNDITNESAATAYSRIQTWCQGRHTAGYKVVVCTIQAGAPVAAGGGFNASRATLNALIYAGWPSFADGLADIAAQTHIGADGDENNTTYYQTDKTHFTTAGFQIAADCIRPVIASL